MARSDERDLVLRWSGRWMLLHRILAINILALAMLAGSIFYLDGFRGRLTENALAAATTEARMSAEALASASPGDRARLLRRLGYHSGTRLRMYGADGTRRLDSWHGTVPTYELRDPAAEPFRKRIARLLDNAFDAIVGAPPPPVLEEPARDELDAWPEARRAASGPGVVTLLRRAPEGTPFISAATRVHGGTVLLLTRNAREVRRVVRDERLTLVLVLLATIIISVLLSLFLARTVATPLRRLARAAHRVRLGRSREVSMPRLPARRDEIGLLARALHDMTQTLRDRIDATESFAADVTHELKNPLASLRSALDGLEGIEDPALRARLVGLVRDDVMRLDRLVVDIAAISRLDAELSRAAFEPVDTGSLIEELVAAWEERASERKVRFAFARPRTGSAVVQGDEARLARAIESLIDNAVSFSPEGGLIEIHAGRVGQDVVVSVQDEGPGVPKDEHDRIFDRFHSVRPEGEAYGRHSGLGLAIARATIIGHGGSLSAEDRHDGRSGARFCARFPEGAG